MTADSEIVRGRTWFERDYPVLLATAELLETSAYSHATTPQIAAKTEIDIGAVVKALTNLKERYVLVTDASTMTSRDYLVTGLTADGLVAADVWPSGDTVAERIIAAIEKALEEAPEGSPKQTKLKSALGSLRDLGVGGAGNILGQAVSSALGLV
ncbi:hypothetical protein [Cellulosimicrobium funkei]